ncbi:MAG: prepilin-type N-terminal cleavage/methylation domain-containing protein [Chthoniobacterales bacterium]
MHSSFSRLHCSKGFTLLEMTMAIGILALIVGGVMACVSACLQATEIVRRDRIHQEQCDALQSILSKSLMALSSDTVLRCSPADARTDEPAPLRFRASQPVLNLMASAVPAGWKSESIFDWRRGADGTLTLRAGILSDQTLNTGFSSRDAMASSSQEWMSLLSGIQSVKLRFYDSEKSEWVESWEKEDSRPALVEMSLSFSDASLPLHSIFWLPAQKVVKNPLHSASSASPAEKTGAVL